MSRSIGSAVVGRNHSSSDAGAGAEAGRSRSPTAPTAIASALCFASLAPPAAACERVTGDRLARVAPSQAARDATCSRTAVMVRTRMAPPRGAQEMRAGGVLAQCRPWQPATRAGAPRPGPSARPGWPGSRPKTSPMPMLTAQASTALQSGTPRPAGSSAAFSSSPAPRPEDDPEQPPDQRQRGGLHQELPQDLAPGGAERLAEADLPGAVGHRDHHDGHHADAAHQQRDARERHHRQEEVGGEVARPRRGSGPA